jgi:hypothetical protein
MTSPSKTREEKRFLGQGRESPLDCPPSELHEKKANSLKMSQSPCRFPPGGREGGTSLACGNGIVMRTLVIAASIALSIAVAGCRGTIPEDHTASICDTNCSSRCPAPRSLGFSASASNEWKRTPIASSTVDSNAGNAASAGQDPSLVAEPVPDEVGPSAKPSSMATVVPPGIAKANTADVNLPSFEVPATTSQRQPFTTNRGTEDGPMVMPLLNLPPIPAALGVPVPEPAELPMDIPILNK